MKTKSIFLSSLGTIVLFLVIVAVFRSLNSGKPGSGRPDLSRSKNDAVLRRPPQPEGAVPHAQTKTSKALESRKVELKWDDLKPLDWSVDELDDFLKAKSTQLTSQEMESLMSRIFPDVKGSEARAHRLKPGSISIRDQMRLGIKYLNDEDQKTLFSLFWYKYRTSNNLGEYHKDVLEAMPVGYARSQAVGDYYGYVYKDYSSVKELLSSDEFPRLKAREAETRIGSSSDYIGAANGVESSLQTILERGDASVVDIVAILEASKLDEARKGEMIRSIERRCNELKILRNQAEPKK